jgi:hypothetical protein
MRTAERNVLDRAENELERICEQMRRNCEDALELLGHIDLEELSPENRERVHCRIHTLREIVRIFRPDFEKKLMVEMDRLRRALSRDEAKTLFYGLDEF